jgi:hypothetical protein
MSTPDIPPHRSGAHLWVWLIRDEVLDHLASVRAAIKHRLHREMVSGSTMRLAMSITAVTPSSPSKAFACTSAARHAGSALRSKSVPVLVNKIGLLRPSAPWRDSSAQPFQMLMTPDFCTGSRLNLVDCYEQGELRRANLEISKLFVVNACDYPRDQSGAHK